METIKEPQFDNSKLRELDRIVWRAYYKDRAVHDILCTTVVKRPPAPIRPEEGDNLVEEPPDLEGFFDNMRASFRMAATNFLDELNHFRGQPKETLTKLATRFDEVAEPLIDNLDMTSRQLALHFVNHVPTHIRKRTMAKMDRADEKRFIAKKPYTTKNELLVMAQESEVWLLAKEAEQRAAGVAPQPRDTEVYKHLPP